MELLDTDTTYRRGTYTGYTLTSEDCTMSNTGYSSPPLSFLEDHFDQHNTFTTTQSETCFLEDMQQETFGWYRDVLTTPESSSCFLSNPFGLNLNDKSSEGYNSGIFFAWAGGRANSQAKLVYKVRPGNFGTDALLEVSKKPSTFSLCLNFYPRSG